MRSRRTTSRRHRPLPRRRNPASSYLRDTIVGEMARTLFVTAWADREEERQERLGRRYKGPFSGSLGGVDLFDIAPRTSTKARTAANKLAREIEKINGARLDTLYGRAESAPGKHYREPTPESFGFGLAMQALGHGVSWRDDHPDAGIKLPYTEFYL